MPRSKPNLSVPLKRIFHITIDPEWNAKRYLTWDFPGALCACGVYSMEALKLRDVPETFIGSDESCDECALVYQVYTL